MLVYDPPLHFALDHSQLYTDAVIKMHFFFNISKIMAHCGVADFGMKDLFCPQSKRFKCQLSAVLYFFVYKEMKHRNGGKVSG